MRINANQGRRLSVRQSSGRVLIAIVLELEEATPRSDLPQGLDSTTLLWSDSLLEVIVTSSKAGHRDEN
jgi:hypothetical protein